MSENSQIGHKTTNKKLNRLQNGPCDKNSPNKVKQSII